ncbi:MAG TPA: ABC transporter ATP-binding protein [Acidimicrobiales bacterium]|nr:ABC transporter ATP-binding protein [Acidimicrobiales bacterium]
MNSHLCARDVTKQFAGLTAVDAVSLEVRPGEIVGLIGPNGAGKTTLFNCLTGFTSLSGGVVTLDDRDISRLDPAARAKLGVARTFQQARLFAHLSVRENMLLGRHLHYGASAWQAAFRTRRARRAEREAIAHVEALAELCGLTQLLDAAVGALPYGTQRMVEVARALALEPTVLLLDEPGAGMDPGESTHFAELLREIHRQRDLSILLIEHDVPMVLSVCQRVYVLEFGRVIANGTPDAIVADPRVRASYLGTEVANV